jgi:hypothetical protein
MRLFPFLRLRRPASTRVFRRFLKVLERRLVIMEKA